MGAMQSHTSAAALGRFRVLDLSRVRAGPSCARILGDFGADVLRIEPPAGVDPNESMFAANRDKGDFQNLNRNKRAMTLNLRTEAGREVLMRLVRHSDVVIENWRPDVKRRLGLDDTALRAVNPRVILASIAGFGQTGPYASRPGFDQIVQGMGGLMSVTGHPGGGPVRAGLAVADLSAGLYAAIGVLVALLEREQSGQGQWVHSSLLHAQIAMMDFQAARYLNEGQVPQQEGNNHPTSSPMGLFQASDGTFNLGVTGEGLWQRLLDVLQQPAALADPRFATEALRVQHRQPLNQALQVIFGAQTVSHWVTQLNQAGVPAGPVYDMAQVFADPQVQHLGVAQALTHTDGTSKQYVTQPVTLSRTPASVRQPAPAWGEHTDDVLTELGYSTDEVARMREQGVV
ncbi:MAG: hypothetical protein RL019_23 [Pseudomonadota bacterium]|jgi:crotonobetainyl-CoA:carnitine CoA-transferase CaiB-like acyl-CoA transferase